MSELNCSFCGVLLTPETYIDTEQGPACQDCGVQETPEPQPQPEIVEQETPQEEEHPQEEQSQQLIDFARIFRELQIVRAKQIFAGETDPVMQKRSLAELLLLIEQNINEAKLNATMLRPDASLRARFYMLNAVVYGIGYLTNHPPFGE